MVFIVEDDLTQQKLLKRHFEDMVGNFSVQTFANPEDMLSRLNEKPFAIVLDHFFGNNFAKTGLDYLKLIKKKHSTIPIIYYTSSDDTTLEARVLKLGAAQYIYKDSASFVRLRTVLDMLDIKSKKKPGFFKRLFKS
jgi:DNA-binding response OmpR family regulator